jgi:hypothetical protein
MNLLSGLLAGKHALSLCILDEIVQTTWEKLFQNSGKIVKKGILIFFIKG